MSPKFSIVIPTVGRLDLIRRTLYSALRQQDDFDDYEVVVLDNCSDDDTWDYLQRIENPRLRILRNSQRLPMASNWNKAVRSSRGEFIYMLQDDDVALPSLLSTVSNAIARHESVDLVCFANQIVLEDEWKQQTIWRPQREELLPAPEALMLFAHKWTSCITYAVFSRATFDRYGEFDENLPIMSDAEAMLRWMIHCNTLLIPDILAMHRIWPGTETAATHYSSEMVDTMVHLTNHTFRLATESNRFDPDQLEVLRQALVQTFQVDLFER